MGPLRSPDAILEAAGARTETFGRKLKSTRPGRAGLSDDSLALMFSEQQENRLLYVAALSRWLIWDGCRWAPDDTRKVSNLVRALCRDVSRRTPGPKAEKLASASTIRAVEGLACVDYRHARRLSDFDADPWALNTPAGVVDLQTGNIRHHRPADLHMKVTAVAPGGKCPRWLRFLLQITQCDKDLVRFLQRFIGYTLTGHTREHAFLFLRGPGGNGKGVLMSTIAAVLGDYAITAMSDLLTVGNHDQHPTHLANLRGARMVQVTEMETGKHFAEARLKALVGGDRVSARVMRGDPFEFQPVAKFWIAGNHSPALRNPDAAMRRRLLLVPLTFVPAKPDLELSERLRAELPGILAWAIRGCIAGQREGLNPPSIVTDASAEYFAEQDSIAAWLAERCDQFVRDTTPARHLYTDWKRWITARGEDPGTEKWFSEGLQQHAAKKRTASGMVFLGLRLRPPDLSGQDW